MKTLRWFVRPDEDLRPLVFEASPLLADTLTVRARGVYVWTPLLSSAIVCDLWRTTDDNGSCQNTDQPGQWQEREQVKYPPRLRKAESRSCQWVPRKKKILPRARGF